MNYAGSVADYTPAKLDAIKASIAKKSGVPAALITNLKAKSWYSEAMHRAARAGKKASVGSESTTILAGGGGVVLTFDMPKSKSAALIKAVKDGKVPMPHPRRDWPTSARGLAHTCAGTCSAAQVTSLGGFAVDSTSISKVETPAELAADAAKKKARCNAAWGKSHAACFILAWCKLQGQAVGVCVLLSWLFPETGCAAARPARRLFVPVSRNSALCGACRRLRHAALVHGAYHSHGLAAGHCSQLCPCASPQGCADPRRIVSSSHVGSCCAVFRSKPYRIVLHNVATASAGSPADTPSTGNQQGERQPACRRRRPQGTSPEAAMYLVSHINRACLCAVACSRRTRSHTAAVPIAVV